MRVIFDTSAFIPENKPEEERTAILKLTELLPDLDVTIYVSKGIIKEYMSKLRLFPSRFRELFRNVISAACRIKPCKELEFGNSKIHRIEPKKTNLDNEFRSIIEDRCRKYDQEDEKFLELFIYLGKSEEIFLVTASEDLACMANEAKRLLNLQRSVRNNICSFLVELRMNQNS